MEKRNGQKWKFSLLTGAVLVTVALYFLFSSETHWSKSWSKEELDAAAEPTINLQLGHGPVSFNPTPPEGDNLTVRLHPELHAERDSKTIRLDWNITKALRRPDGVAKDVYLVNGEFPGPSVECRSGDELVVTVRNQLEADEGLAIHWHGLWIENEMDGVVGVTQCPILPTREFTYRLNISENQHGTFWWHSHSETQRADGLFGSLVIHKPVAGLEKSTETDEHREDQVLMLGDWYHRPAKDVLESYTDWKNFKIEPAPDSMLLNGKGAFNCSMALPARPVDCIHSGVPSLTLGERTRLRVINVGALVGFSMRTSGYAITLISVDGGGVVEAVSSAKVGILYPGERIDLILERRLNNESSWIAITLDRENMQFPNLALSPEQRFQILHENPAPWPGKVDLEPRWPAVDWIDLSKTNGSKIPSGSIPLEADKTMLLYSTISYLTQFEYRPKGFVNHTSWSPSSAPDSSPLITLSRDKWPTDPAPLTVTVEDGQWIDIVINNVDDKGHPFHLHGHSFYVIASHRASRTGAFEQYNPYDPNKQPAGGPMNLVNPLLKDMVYVASMGYVVIRFKAVPGLWLVHCHVLWHESVGMNMVLDVGSDDRSAVVERVAQQCAG